MYAVVVKPFTAYGVPYNPGDMVDISAFPKGDQLKRGRYLRDATVDEVMAATGEKLPAAPNSTPLTPHSPATVTPVKAGKPKVVTERAPAKKETVPLRQSRQARAKATRARV